MTTTLDWDRGMQVDAWVNPNLFGGNLLFDRDRVDGTYDTVYNDLGLSGVRYPGGSISEWYFDIKNPDATEIWDPDLGEMRALLPLSDFLKWAGENGHPATLVVPTGSLMTGPKGNQVPQDSAYRDIKNYVLDVLSGKYGEAQIDAFELGNEYWLGAELNVVEYARIADLMAIAVQDAIDAHRASGGVGKDWVEPEIVVQVGQFGLFSQSSGWEQNEYLMDALSDEAAQAIDGVVMHYYTRGKYEDLPEYDYFFERLNEWSDEWRFADIKHYMTEWGTDFQDSDERGIRQASTMIWMMTEMVIHGIDYAHVWPVQQNTKNDLSGDEGQADLTLAGEGVRMVAESVQDMTLDTRLQFDGGVGYLFRGDGETVVLLTSRSESSQKIILDTKALGLSGQGHWTTDLDTAGAANRADAPPAMTILADLGAAGDKTAVTLDPYGIARLTFTDAAPRELAGSAGGDLIRGGDLGEVLDGRNGDDVILGGAGSDTIHGQDGNDTLGGGLGGDLILGGAGDDLVHGGQGSDFVDLGAGDDRFEDMVQTGTDGADKVYGGPGNDYLIGRGGDDGLSGDEGDDTVEGGDGGDTLLGLTGSDLLFGGTGGDDLDGGAGDDLLYGGPDDDILDGGAGADGLDGGNGNDTLHGSLGTDTIIGASGADVLGGGDGNDVLLGGIGRDTLAGGNGDDTLRGEAGADVFVFDRDDGLDIIVGYDDGDLIDLRGNGLAFDEITLDRQGRDAVVSFAGTTILIEDMGGRLSADDFLFA